MNDKEFLDQIIKYTNNGKIKWSFVNESIPSASYTFKMNQDDVYISEYSFLDYNFNGEEITKYGFRLIVSNEKDQVYKNIYATPDDNLYDLLKGLYLTVASVINKFEQKVNDFFSKFDD